MIKSFLRKELSYFNKLHQDAKRLITTIFLYNFISPFFGIFLNAFLWRQSHSIEFVALYNVIMYAVIPIGFYLNGYLLRKYSPAILYILFLILGVIAIAVLLFLPTISYTTIILFSLVDGLSSGGYWANRNLLTLKTTTTHDRIYFSSIEIASSTITGVIIPILIGWFITFGAFAHLYTPIQGYQLLVIYIIIMMLRIETISKTITTSQISVPVLFVKNVSSSWKKFRWIEFIMGMQNAIYFFVPVLLVLILVGNEAALGTVQSFCAIVASSMIYWLGKSSNTTHRVKIIAASVIVTIVGALFFGAFYSAIGVFMLIASQTVAQQLLWVGGNSINYDLIDMDNKDPNQHYAYVCDQEIYLNGGRVVGILLFLLFLFLTSNTFTLRFSPLLFAFTQIFLLFTVYAIEKNKNTNKNNFL